MKSATGTAVVFFILIECRANFTDPEEKRKSRMVTTEKSRRYIQYIKGEKKKENA